MRFSSFSLVIFFVLKSTLSDVTITTAAFFDQQCQQIHIFPSLKFQPIYVFIFKGAFLAIDVVEFYLFIQSYTISLLSEVLRTFSLNVNIDFSVFKSVVPSHCWFYITSPVLSPLFLSFPAVFFYQQSTLPFSDWWRVYNMHL